ncbi:MAG: T9SS type A sorting domain-containing protein [Owenweeksia sp.]|nr:T9SS type A sorting domain-containing protein [Owenweeksia sp.]
MYPNPNNGRFNIRLSQAINEPSEVHIYNYAGQLLQEDNLKAGTKELTVKGLTPGVYLVQWRYARKTVTKKIIVQR